MTEQRRLAAIVSADVAGYSRLMGRDESGTLAALKALRQEVVDPAIANHGGRIVKTTGDGLLLEFPSVVNAVRCAVEVQTAIADRTAGIAEDRRIAFRVGVNIGDIIVEGEDIFGDGVNVAARLQEIAAPGGICISSRVHEDVRDRLDAAFDDGGTQTLKNIVRPVQVWRWQPGLTALPQPAPAPTALQLPDKPSIAVLPFQNMSGDAEQEYFVDGITEDIITDLSRWRRLAVQSRSASFRYRDANRNLQQIAHEINVRYILEGSVRRLGEHIRVTAHLVDSETGSDIWAERFDRAAADLFKVQDEVVQTIVGTLVGRVQAADEVRTRRKAPVSLAAYECVLKGNAMSWFDAQGAAEAARLFEKAIDLDPGYGFAHALLAVVRYREWRDDLDSSDDAALNEFYRLAKRAVELASNESTCFSVLSRACLYRRSFDVALQHIQRAIEINPTNQWVTADMGSVLSYLGRAEEAIACFKRARQIDPYFDPPWYWVALGRTQLVRRQYDEAVAAFERSSARPFYVAAYLAGCHALLGNSGKAHPLLVECLRKKPDFTIARWMAKEPFKKPADAAHLAECLRAAGFPE